MHERIASYTNSEAQNRRKCACVTQPHFEFGGRLGRHPASRNELRPCTCLHECTASAAKGCELMWHRAMQSSQSPFSTVSSAAKLLSQQSERGCKGGRS